MSALRFLRANLGSSGLMVENDEASIEGPACELNAGPVGVGNEAEDTGDV